MVRIVIGIGEIAVIQAEIGFAAIFHHIIAVVFFRHRSGSRGSDIDGARRNLALAHHRCCTAILQGIRAINGIVLGLCAADCNIITDSLRGAGYPGILNRRIRAGVCICAILGKIRRGHPQFQIITGQHTCGGISRRCCCRSITDPAIDRFFVGGRTIVFLSGLLINRAMGCSYRHRVVPLIARIS